MTALPVNLAATDRCSPHFQLKSMGTYLSTPKTDKETGMSERVALLPLENNARLLCALPWSRLHTLHLQNEAKDAISLTDAVL